MPRFIQAFNLAGLDGLIPDRSGGRRRILRLEHDDDLRRARVRLCEWSEAGDVAADRGDRAETAICDANKDRMMLFTTDELLKLHPMK